METTPNPAPRWLFEGMQSISVSILGLTSQGSVGGRGAGSSVKPNSSGLPMTCCQLSRAAGQQLILTPLKRDQITRTGRWTLVRLGEEDGGSLSVWRERDTQDLSRRKLARIRAL